MIRKKLLLFIGFSLFWALQCFAQYDVSFSHYYDMETSFNPAAAGKVSKLNVDVAYASDFTGFKHNPQTMYASADMPFRLMNVINGAGLVFMNDKLGLYTHQKLAAQYAYKFKLFKGTMSVGIQAGLLSENFDGTKLDLEDPNDTAFTKSSINGNSLDLGAGVYYTYKDKWYAGLSCQHLTAPDIDLGDNNTHLKVDRSYYLTAGYNIKLRNPFLQIRTSGLLRTDLSAYRGDVTARLQYTNDKKMMYAGLGYSPTNSVTVLIGGNFHGVVVGYSYEVYTSALSLSNGSHEFFVGYQTDVNLLKKGKNLHKSVRIL